MTTEKIQYAARAVTAVHAIFRSVSSAVFPEIILRNVSAAVGRVTQKKENNPAGNKYINIS